MPKRTSQKQKKLTDSQNLKPTIKAEPIDPQPASGLDATGKAEWQRIINAYEKSGRLCELDQSILALYCAAYSRWKRAEASLLANGDVILVDVRDTHGVITHQKPIVNPMAKVAEAAARATHRFGDALGLSPASRTKQGFEYERKTDEEEEESEFAID